MPQDAILFNDTIAYNIAYGAISTYKGIQLDTSNADLHLKHSDEVWKDFFMNPPVGNKPPPAKDDGEPRPDPKDIKPTPSEQAVINRLDPVCRHAMIRDFIKNKPAQYLDHVGERGLKLSGGEKQRMSIARALLKQAKIICFDEATSALDNETEHEVQAAIDNVCSLGYEEAYGPEQSSSDRLDTAASVSSLGLSKSKRPTILIIAHRLATVRNCDKIIVLDKGSIVEEGSHDELLAMDGKYKSLWMHQAEAKMKRTSINDN